jgi:hypothetical protein
LFPSGKEKYRLSSVGIRQDIILLWISPNSNTRVIAKGCFKPFADIHTPQVRAFLPSQQLQKPFARIHAQAIRTNPILPQFNPMAKNVMLGVKHRGLPHGRGVDRDGRGVGRADSVAVDGHFASTSTGVESGLPPEQIHRHVESGVAMFLRAYRPEAFTLPEPGC